MKLPSPPGDARARDRSWCGRNVARSASADSAPARRVGVVFQDFKLIPTRTAEENVAVALEVIGKSPREVRGKSFAMLKRVGLQHRRHHRPAALSGGEQQRVALARALVNDPAILLADEPTGNLDAALTLEIMDLIAAAAARGTTVLVASHDAALVKRYARRVLRLEGGQLVEDLSGSAIRTRVVFQLYYFVRAAIAGLRGSQLTTVVSIATIAVAVIPLGGLWVVTGNMRALLDQFGNELQLTAFLDAKVRSDAGRSLAARASAIPGVERVEFVSQEQALSASARDSGQRAARSAEANPLPASLAIALAPDHQTPEAVAACRSAASRCPVSKRSRAARPGSRGTAARCVWCAVPAWGSAWCSHSRRC
jgi:cell division transport system ATP-binding protein